jgi:hypothetical protein
MLEFDISWEELHEIGLFRMNLSQKLTIYWLAAAISDDSGPEGNAIFECMSKIDIGNKGAQIRDIELGFTQEWVCTRSDLGWALNKLRSSWGRRGVRGVRGGHHGRNRRKAN